MRRSPEGSGPGYPEVITVPTLFLAGSRDRLTPLELLGPVVGRLPFATLRVFDGGDHSFGVKAAPDDRGRAALDQLAVWTVEWLASVAGPSAG
jgi:pimeloyl-ACP methyl ester carboxylesterase